MMPRTSPWRTARSTFETAVKPPNRLVRFLISSSIDVGLLRRIALDRADGLEPPPHEEVVNEPADPARHEDDHQHDDGAEHQHAVLVVVAREVVDDRHQDGADH